MKCKGLVQIPLMITLLVVAVALPVASRLVKNVQDTRNRAATTGCNNLGDPCCYTSEPARAWCNNNLSCSLTPGVNFNKCVTGVKKECSRCSSNNGCQKVTFFTYESDCAVAAPIAGTTPQYSTDCSCPKRNGAGGGNDNACNNCGAKKWYFCLRASVAGSANSVSVSAVDSGAIDKTVCETAAKAYQGYAGPNHTEWERGNIYDECVSDPGLCNDTLLKDISAFNKCSGSACMQTSQRHFNADTCTRSMQYSAKTAVPPIKINPYDICFESNSCIKGDIKCPADKPAVSCPISWLPTPLKENEATCTSCYDSQGTKCVGRCLATETGSTMDYANLTCEKEGKVCKGGACVTPDNPIYMYFCKDGGKIKAPKTYLENSVGFAQCKADNGGLQCYKNLADVPCEPLTKYYYCVRESEIQNGQEVGDVTVVARDSGKTTNEECLAEAKKYVGKSGTVEWDRGNIYGDTCYTDPDKCKSVPLFFYNKCSGSACPSTKQGHFNSATCTKSLQTAIKTANPNAVIKPSDICFLDNTCTNGPIKCPAGPAVSCNVPWSTTPLNNDEVFCSNCSNGLGTGCVGRCIADATSATGGKVNYSYTPCPNGCENGACKGTSNPLYFMYYCSGVNKLQTPKNYENTSTGLALCKADMGTTCYFDYNSFSCGAIYKDCTSYNVKHNTNFCNANIAMYCWNGDATVKDTCDKFTETCINGKCEPKPPCTSFDDSGVTQPGVYGCNALYSRAKCVSGTEWTDSEPCPFGCANGNCKQDTNKDCIDSNQKPHAWGTFFCEGDVLSGCGDNKKINPIENCADRGKVCVTKSASNADCESDCIDSYKKVHATNTFFCEDNILKSCTKTKIAMVEECAKTKKECVTLSASNATCKVINQCQEECPSGKPSRFKGNANCDGVIDGHDFGVWLGEYITTKSQASWFADFNCPIKKVNQKPDLEDFGVWLGSYSLVNKK